MAECFSYVSRVTASTAFGKLLRALVPLTTQLVSDSHGVHVMLKLADLGEPEELLVLGWHMVSEVWGELVWAVQGCASRGLPTMGGGRREGVEEEGSGEG